MRVLLKAKIGPFLVIFSVLAMWTLLAAQPVAAHKPDSPSCSGLPTATGFFTTNETGAITPNDLAPTPSAKVGTGNSGEGNTRYRYAKITVPQLAAGELRVFDTRTAGDNASDAVLCHGTSQRARYRTSHPSSHSSAESARTSATNAQATATAAATAAGLTNASESTAKSALRTAASALTSARNALTSAATALTNAGKTSEAGTASGEATSAATAATTATAAANLAADQSASDEGSALTNAATALGTAATALSTAADELHDATAASTVFQLRAEVRPGDEEYILVTTLDNPSLAVRFNGAIAATTARRERSLNPGDQHTSTITVTAPGLLTVETTGSTDTDGMLSGTPAVMDDDSGSGNNFKMVVPVTATDYTLTVDGKTASTTGDYTLDMDFKVAMQTGASGTNITVPAAPGWPNTTVAADDTTVQIQRIAADGNRADEDYFLLTIDDDYSGVLTVQTVDATAATKDSDTAGAFYGPTGEIATDSNSGAGNHFKIRAPVRENASYLVKVTGSDGQYQLNLTLDDAEGTALLSVPGAQNGPSNGFNCSDNDADPDNDPGEICPPDSGDPLEIERYVFNVTESGALDVRTTGSTDTVGTLYGPNGSQIATDDNSGTDNNFRISASVSAGLHLIEVRGQNRHTQGVFNLIVNFVPGAQPTDPTDPGSGDELTRLRAEVARLQNELNACRGTVTTNAYGALENPSNNGHRSGIGVISGWVCAAEDVEVEISRGGVVQETFQVGYGTSRPDTVGQCGHSSANTGFGMTYNFNHLAEGIYTITAFADDQQIGETQSFEVVHIAAFAATDTDRFLRDLPAAQCIVPDFPATGERTWLLWEESTQNFVIEDQG